MITGGGADGDWLLRMADRYDITSIDDILYMYRDNPASVTRIDQGGALTYRFRVLAAYAAEVRRRTGHDPLDAPG